MLRKPEQTDFGVKLSIMSSDKVNAGKNENDKNDSISGNFIICYNHLLFSPNDSLHEEKDIQVPKTITFDVINRYKETIIESKAMLIHHYTVLYNWELQN